MYINTFVTPFFILFVFFGLAQDLKLTDSICFAYDQEIQKSIDEEMPELVPSFVSKTERIERAIGNVTYTTTSFYDDMEEVVETADQTIYVETAILRKVIFERQAGYRYTRQIYYYNSLGELIKYTFEEESKAWIKDDYYFDNGKMVRRTDEPETDEDFILEKKVLKSSEHFKKLLQLNFELIKS